MNQFTSLYEPSDKTVQLFDQMVIVPAWSQYIATDKWGDVYAFVEEPEEDDGRWISYSTKELIGTVKPFPEWQNSLISLH